MKILSVELGLPSSWLTLTYLTQPGLGPRRILSIIDFTLLRSTAVRHYLR